MDNDEPRVPRVALLGIAERGKHRVRDPAFLSHVDVLGLRHVVLSYLYPFELSGLSLAIAVYDVGRPGLGHIVVRNRSGGQVFRVDLTMSEIPSPNGLEETADNPPSTVLIYTTSQPCWSVILMPFPSVVLDEPQALDAFLVEGDREMPLGVLAFGLATEPPLTPDRVAAIKADPTASKAVKLIVGCKHCESELKVFGALEKPREIETGLVWYQDLEDMFSCSCGRTRFSLQILKSNMHAMFGHTRIPTRNVTLVTLYERRVLEDLSQKLLELIGTDPREEEVQRFLSDNPVLLQFLSPYRLFKKPPILSKHQADFAVIDGRGTLTFVEIERPGIRLLRKDGAASADIEHSISQVRDWLFLYEKHRSAVLQCLDLADAEVTRARGLVIAGRDNGNDPESLRRFKWQDRGAIECMTYDDLLALFAALRREMSSV